MDDLDVAIRNSTYRLFVDLGRAPAPDEVGDVEGLSADDVAAAWRRLHDAHALVLHPNGTLRMANPFAAAPTAYRVAAGGRRWFANCAWDAFGVCAALGVDGDIDATCPDCGDAISVAVRDRQPDDRSLLFHCLVPAAHWWDDIGFT